MQDGIINVFKPKQCTSHDVVARIKKITNKKVGHTGTLDPLAQGVLPILIGKGTMCSKYLINHDKTYKVKLILGKRTETSDSEGRVIEEKNVPENLLVQENSENIRNILNQFKGKQFQKPPIYSAIKVDGKKLYEYARKGQTIEVKPREITIYDIKLLNINLEEQSIDFEVSCSKGTYIRSLCEDIARKLGTVGYMGELLRTQVGEFKIENSFPLKTINKKGNELYDKIDYEKIENNIIGIEQIFSNYGLIKIEEFRVKHFLNGVKITIKKSDGIYRVYHQTGEFIGIGILENQLLKRDIII